MKSINPATEEVIAECAEHTRAQIEQAMQAARRGFSEWKKTTLAHRGDLMRKAASVLRTRRDVFAKMMTLEVGKPITSSEGEIEKCADCCNYFAENASRFLEPVEMKSDASRSYVRFEPIGPILAIMPWNFPFWQLFRFGAAALVAGNVVVMKHAPNVPGCSLAIESVFKEAGFPSGVFSALLVSDNIVAEKLVEHPVVRAVTLTGSERAGAAVSSAAGRVLKKSVMELGGSDAFIVLSDVDVEKIAKQAAEARCINSGQSCIAAKRFIVVSEIYEEFETAMTRAMAQMQVGDPMDRATKIGPMARRDLVDALDRQVHATIAKGAKLRLGGKRRSGKGFFFEATVISDVVPGMAAFDEETFGPVAAVIRAENVDDAVQLANHSRYGLGASIWTNDLFLGQQLAERIEAGTVFINGMVKSDPHLPFGGIKNSGWGRELSEFGIREFTNIKSIWVK